MLNIPAESVSIAAECDICVIGGGCTGVFAAIRAARLGAKVVIVEKQNRFGGVATSGRVNTWHCLYDISRRQQIIAGLTVETLERLQKRGAATDYRQGHSVLNSDELSIELDEMAIESGIKFYFHCFFSSAVMEEGKVIAVVIQNKSGRQAIKAKVFIDASGDADLCASAGFETYIPDSLQPMTAFADFSGWDPGDANPFQIIAAHAGEFNLPPGFFFGVQVPPHHSIYTLNGTRVRNRLAVNAKELSEAEVEGRRQIRAIMDILKKYCPNCKLQLSATPSCIGIRESRHIRSAYQLKGEDVLNGKRFDDAVANGTYPVDVHHPDKGGVTLKYLDGRERYCAYSFSDTKESRWREERADNPQYYQLPLRSFIPVNSKNVICAGRMIDADKEAFAASRVMVNLNQVG